MSCSGARTRTRLVTLSTMHFRLQTLSQVSLNLLAISPNMGNKLCLLKVRQFWCSLHAAHETNGCSRCRCAISIPKCQLRPVPAWRLQPHSSEPVPWLPHANLWLPTTRHIPTKWLPAVENLDSFMLAITNLLLCRPRKS